MSFYSKRPRVENETTDLPKMDELKQTYSGLILSTLNSDEVTRLSPLLLFLSIIRFCGMPGNGIVYRNRWRNYLLEGIQRCIDSSQWRRDAQLSITDLDCFDR